MKRKGKSKVFRMELIVEDQNQLPKDSHSKAFIVDEYTTWDGPTIPLSKPASMGIDEKQDTHNHPGWWFLLKRRDFRPLPSNLDTPFPCDGKKLVSFNFYYGSNFKVFEVRALLDFERRPLDVNAKIHLDKNHTLSERDGESQVCPEDELRVKTDYLLLRIINRHLVTMRLFVPLVILRTFTPLESWVQERERKMYEHVGLSYEEETNEQIKPLPVKRLCTQKEPKRSQHGNPRKKVRRHIVEEDEEPEDDGEETFGNNKAIMSMEDLLCDAPLQGITANLPTPCYVDLVSEEEEEEEGVLDMLLHDKGKRDIDRDEDVQLLDDEIEIQFKNIVPNDGTKLDSPSFPEMLDIPGIDVSQLEYSQHNSMIGSGSFAMVYRAKYESEDVAVKHFKPNEKSEKIDNELHILKVLYGHPNIVRLVGYSVVDGQKRIAMEYCAFGNLYDLIHTAAKGHTPYRNGRSQRAKTAKGMEYELSLRKTRQTRRSTQKKDLEVTETPEPKTSGRSKRKREGEEESQKEIDPYFEFKRRRENILMGIARGMQHVHHHGVCHRDLSSMNVLVDGHWEPKIADFGLSTYRKTEITNMGVGTRRWRAPEVFKQKPKNCKQFKGFYTNKSDVYSFGVIAWELFHLGLLPWEGELDEDITRKVLEGERPKIANDVPELWRSLITHCWSHDPEQRPTFDNIVTFLERHPVRS